MLTEAKMTIKEYNIHKQDGLNEVETIRSLIIGTGQHIYNIRKYLAENGINCSIAWKDEEIFREISEQSPHVVLIELGNSSFHCSELAEIIRREKRLPVLALLTKEALRKNNVEIYFDDFILEPYQSEEIIVRIRRLLKSGFLNLSENQDEVIKAGDLIINVSKCEVTLNGKIIILAFKEYELLKFLATNPGRVFTRQMLLDRVWGYDYFGGDRTVDVHIRRLRSKIEDGTHTFIETVRSIGYRFREDL